MRIQVSAVGIKMPAWVSAGVEEYTARLPREWQMQWKEISPVKRTANYNVTQVKQQEGEKILQSIPASSIVIALDQRGLSWSSEDLAMHLKDWLNEGQYVTFMVGGADGLDKKCLDKAQLRWSLSLLTFPHALVRVLLVEQLYRAWTILKGHPYHTGH